MQKEKVGEFKDFTDGGEKTYKNDVMFARISKKGEHIYIFNNKGILNPKYASLLINIGDMEKLISRKYENIKVSAMEVKEEDDLGAL